MKKLSKLFVALTLVCTLALSVGCGAKGLANNLETVQSRLEKEGYDVTVTKIGSTVSMLKNDVKALGLKGDYYEVVAKMQTYFLDTDVNFSLKALGNYYEDVEGDYVLVDGAMVPYVDGAQGTRYSRDTNLYLPENDGDYIYDAEAGKYVLDDGEYYFLVKEGSFYYDETTSAFVEHTGATATYVKDNGHGLYYVDDAGSLVYENGEFVKDNDINYSAKEDGTYSKDVDGLFVKDANGNYVVDDDVNYSFEKRGDYIFNVDEDKYEEFDGVRFKCVEDGNYVEKKGGDYVKVGGKYVLDTDVNYTQSGDSFVENKDGKYVLSGTTYTEIYNVYVKNVGEGYTKDNGDRYVLEGTNYVKLNSKDKGYVKDENGNCASASNYFKNGEGSGEYLSDGTLDTRVKYIKVQDGYVEDTVKRYDANGTEVQLYARFNVYVQDDNGEFKFENGKYSRDTDKNYAFVEDRYVLDEDGRYLYDEGKGEFKADNDVNYAYDEETDTYTLDPTGDYVQDTNTIVVFIFEKSSASSDFYSELRPKLFNTYFKNDFKDESNAFYGNIVSGKNGKIIYLGIADYLDVLGDVRL